MATAATTTTTTRLKREDYKQTKHDTHFSKWQLLVGPSDWEDHSLGKEGALRYRIHNLPSTSGPGLYELGIAVSRSRSGRDIVGKIDLDDVVVVYLGQADSVRTRLQQYGRSGAHLGNGYSADSGNGYKDDSAQMGLGFFEKISERGHSIVFRWASMKEKRDAEKTESKLLKTFDYAWNKGSNGARRPGDIFQKLEKITSRTYRLPKISKRLLFVSRGRVGIKITASKPPSPEKCPVSDEDSKNIFSGVFGFGRSKQELVTDKYGINEDFVHICGFIMTDGIACRRPPVSGRKRCEEHRGRRVYGSSYEPKTEGSSHYPREAYPDCRTDHDQEDNNACGVNLGDGSFCRRQAVVGRQRCKEHKGMRINSSVSKRSAEAKIHAPGLSSNFCSDSYISNNGPCKTDIGNTLQYGSSDSSVMEHFPTTCGATLGNGSFCSRQPVHGNKRCWQHKGKGADCTMSGIDSSVKEHFPTTCGATLGNGSFCSRQPVHGNKRCWQHKGMRADCTLSGIDSSFFRFDTATCGVTLQNGSFCMRAPVNGRKRCEQHKGMRVSAYY